MQHHWKGPHHVALCGSVSGDDLLVFFFSPFAYVASNSILIVYIASDSHLLPSALLFLSLLYPLFSLLFRRAVLSVPSWSFFISLLCFLSPCPRSSLLLLFSLLFKGLDDGQVGVSTGLCSTEGSVPPCAKVMLGSHIVFYE